MIAMTLRPYIVDVFFRSTAFIKTDHTGVAHINITFKRSVSEIFKPGVFVRNRKLKTESRQPKRAFPNVNGNVKVNFAVTVKRCLKNLQMELSEEELSAHTDRLAGMSIVISGVFARHSRDEYKALIERHGGKNVGSISAKTSFILAGENMGPAKLEKAQKLGIRIVGEDEFLEMIE